MVPTSFLGFFAASAGASAALIGLLFVAISITPERIISQQTERNDASSANAAPTQARPS
ncbi:MAG TPA: hypothetical protein VMV29_12380 [Ktedonobacterales bacterium]|nr:hypothetical protein [Ktedonobacterales bacterium]